MDGILKLWIIDKESGICFFDETFQELPKDTNPDLISGFFIAILSFGQEIADQDIKYIQLTQLRIYFHQVDRYVLTIYTTNDIDPDAATEALVKIQTRFSDKYSQVLKNGFIGETSVFNSFASDVEEILGGPAQDLGFFDEQTENLKAYYDLAKSQWKSLRRQLIQQIDRINEQHEKTKDKLKERLEEAKDNWHELKKNVHHKLKHFNPHKTDQDSDSSTEDNSSDDDSSISDENS